MKNKKTTILVTGLNGIMGWHLFKAASRNYRTMGTYRKQHKPFEGDCFYRTDLRDEKAVQDLVQEIQPDYFIHAWAMCDLDLCEDIPEMAFKINVESTKHILRVAKNCRSIKKFVYISTDHVFCGEQGDYTELDKPKPLHVYGETKKQAELLVQESGLPYMIIRPGLVIGDSAQGNIGPRDFLLSRIKANKPTHYFTDEWRSPLSGDMFGEMSLQLILSANTGIFHVAGDKSFNRYDLALKIAADQGLPTNRIYPRLRKEDKYAEIRPRNLTLKSSTFSCIFDRFRSMAF